MIERDLIQELDCLGLELEAETLRVVYVHHSDERPLGYPVSHWYEEPDFLLNTVVHPSDREAVAARLLQTEVDERADFGFRGVRSNGEIVTLRALFRLLEGSSEERLLFRGILLEEEGTDVSLRTSEDRLQLALDSANMGVWDWNVAQSSVFWSDQVYHLHGVSKDDLGSEIGDYVPLIERVQPDDLELIQERIRRALATGEDYDMEYRFRIDEGAYRWLYVRGRIYFDEQYNPVRIAGTVQDITPQKVVEEALRDLTEGLERRVFERTAELEEANRHLKKEIDERVRTERALEIANRALRQSNRELQQFAYVASHDLREPLRKITTFADLLHTDCGDTISEQGKFYIDRMQESAERMSRLIGDLLEYSRVKTRGEAFAEINLNDILRHVISDLEVRIQETEATVRVDELPSIEADATQMRQLFQNLISNALKFRTAGIDPVVHVKLLSEKHAGEEPSCQIVVCDNGIGFDNQYAERIFSPFQRLNSRGYEGTGIGLAICRRIVERHHGSIVAAGVPGNGATFSIELPVRQMSGDA